MERYSALSLSLLFFFIFTILSYCGAKISFFSSITIGFFYSLILLNVFYPFSEINNSKADFSLLLFVLFQLLAIFVISLYIIYKTFNDVRKEDL